MRGILVSSVALAMAACATPAQRSPVEEIPRVAPGRAALLPDVSGLAWLGGDRFLAVHDAKVPEEAHLPRVSLLTSTDRAREGSPTCGVVSHAVVR